MKAIVLRDFADEGTGKSYAEGDTPDLDRGTFVNYRHAGLVKAARGAKAAPPPAAD